MLTIIANLVFKTAHLSDMSESKGVAGRGLGYIELVSPDLNEHARLPSTRSIPCLGLFCAAFIGHICALVALRPHRLSACSYPGLPRLTLCYSLICAGSTMSFLTILSTVIYVVTIITCLTTWIISWKLLSTFDKWPRWITKLTLAVYSFCVILGVVSFILEWVGSESTHRRGIIISKTSSRCMGLAVPLFDVSLAVGVFCLY